MAGGNTQLTRQSGGHKAGNSGMVVAQSRSHQRTGVRFPPAPHWCLPKLRHHLFPSWRQSGPTGRISSFSGSERRTTGANPGRQRVQQEGMPVSGHAAAPLMGVSRWLERRWVGHPAGRRAGPRWWPSLAGRALGRAGRACARGAGGLHVPGGSGGWA